MTDATLHHTRIRAGIWEGLLTGQTDTPRVEVMHLETALVGVSVVKVADVPGQWAVQVPIPAQTLSDGVQTFIIRDIGTGAKLAHFTVIAGEAATDDIRAEIDLLRAEMDLLKRAFRRHCVETAS
jgi:hypothetical protein